MMATLEDINWWAVAAFLGGGAATKGLEWIYQWIGERRAATKVVDRHLDPLLKAGDELVGKIRWLARTDFRELRKPPSDPHRDIEFLGTVYLFAQFWAWEQLLRRESEYVVLSSVAKGANLQSFFRSLETTRLQIVSRSHQRGIGGALLAENHKNERVVTLFDFVRLYRTDAGFREWFEPLVELLLSTVQTRARQRLLVFGAVVHAMLDTLDTDHRVSRDRPGWGNKLTKRSRRELEFRVFREYLPMVDRPYSYTRPQPKKQAPAELWPPLRATTRYLGAYKISSQLGALDLFEHSATEKSIPRAYAPPGSAKGSATTGVG